MKQCSSCKKPYANPTDYCTETCHLLAIKDRVHSARKLIHQPKHAMRDRDMLFKLLEPRI